MTLICLVHSVVPLPELPAAKHNSKQFTSSTTHHNGSLLVLTPELHSRLVACSSAHGSVSAITILYSNVTPTEYAVQPEQQFMTMITPLCSDSSDIVSYPKPKQTEQREPIGEAKQRTERVLGVTQYTVFRNHS